MRRKKARTDAPPPDAGSSFFDSGGPTGDSRHFLNSSGFIRSGSVFDAISTTPTPNRVGNTIATRIPGKGCNQDLSVRPLSKEMSVPVISDPDNHPSGSVPTLEESELTPEPAARKGRFTQKMNDKLENQKKKYEEELSKERSAHRKTKAKLEAQKKRYEKKKKKLRKTRKLIEDAKKEPTAMINSLLYYHGDGKFMTGYPQEATNGRTLLDDHYILKSNGKVEKRSGFY